MNSNTEKPIADKKVVSPLKKLLMNSSMDELLLYFHRSNLSWSLSRQADGHYNAVIYRDGLARYQGGSDHSARSAFCDALALFLTHEQRDIHEFGIE